MVFVAGRHLSFLLLFCGIIFFLGSLLCLFWIKESDEGMERGCLERFFFTLASLWSLGGVGGTVVMGGDEGYEEKRKETIAKGGSTDS